MADPSPSRPEGPGAGAAAQRVAADRAAADDAALAAHATTLADAVDAALGPWVLRCVERRLREAGREPTAEVEQAARSAGDRCRDEVGTAVRALLAADPDEQRSTPLVLLRAAVRFPTEVLAAAGVAPVDRDDFARRNFPDDPYDLTPASFADVDGSLQEPGLVWGAAKAHVHLARRRDEGRT
jgi:hypothetical protein